VDGAHKGQYVHVAEDCAARPVAEAAACMADGGECCAAPSCHHAIISSCHQVFMPSSHRIAVIR
jgi:hypothetical protein